MTPTPPNFPTPTPLPNPAPLPAPVTPAPVFNPQNPPRVPAPSPANAAPGVYYFYDYDPLPAPGMVFSGLPFDTFTVDLFDRFYIRSKPPVVQALWRGQVGERIVGTDGYSVPTVAMDSAERYALAVQLAQQGYQIDIQRDAYGADPYISIYDDGQAGVAWTSPMLSPGQTGSSLPAPPGMITLSLDVASYPPFIPTPPPPPANTQMVKGYAAGTLYFATDYAISQFHLGLLAVGQKIVEGGVTYYFRAVYQLMGWAYFFDATPPVASS